MRNAYLSPFQSFSVKNVAFSNSVVQEMGNLTRIQSVIPHTAPPPPPPPFFEKILSAAGLGVLKSAHLFL